MHLPLLFLLLRPAAAHEGFSVQAAWRPTLRRGYVFYGTDNQQIPLGTLIAGADPPAESGLANSHGQLGRFEASLHYNLTDELALYTQVMGGAFRLRFTPDEALHQGTDWSVDLGGSVGVPITEQLHFETVMAARVRAWALGDDVPLHGNVGVVLGVKPAWRGLSLYVEATLSAVWLTDLTAWGAQKDSSILRVRPGYTWTHDALDLTVSLDYYHTHTEFFGTELIPDQDAFMLDDFDLALVVGAGWRF